MLSHSPIKNHSFCMFFSKRIRKKNGLEKITSNINDIIYGVDVVECGLEEFGSQTGLTVLGQKHDLGDTQAESKEKEYILKLEQITCEDESRICKASCSQPEDRSSFRLRHQTNGIRVCKTIMEGFDGEQKTSVEKNWNLKCLKPRHFLTRKNVI